MLDTPELLIAVVSVAKSANSETCGGRRSLVLALVSVALVVSLKM